MTSEIKELMQTYVDNFGNEAACKIMEVIVSEIGGLRLNVPAQSEVRRSANKGLARLYGELRRKFGTASGKCIMRIFIVELGGQRVSFPDIRSLYKAVRNERIMLLSERGYTDEQLGQLFSLSESHVNAIRKEMKWK